MIKLLVADDSALMRKLLEGIFLAQGDFEIKTARDGEEALELVRTFKPDVVTLDVQMPGMDGLSCLARIMLESPGSSRSSFPAGSAGLPSRVRCARSGHGWSCVCSRAGRAA